MNTQDFERYWKSFSNKLQSYIIKESKTNTLRADGITKEKNMLISKWFQSQTAEGIWYKELSDIDNYKAEAFRETLGSFTFKQENVNKPNLVRYYLIGIVVSILCIIVSIIIFNGWKAFFIALMCIMLTFVFVIPWGQHQVDKANRAESNGYINQLNDLQKSVYNLLKNS